jgi:hypothetical protein
VSFPSLIGLALEPEEREGAEGTGEALDGELIRERDGRGEHLRHHAAQQPAAREVVLDVGEGHPGGAVVLSDREFSPFTVWCRVKNGGIVTPRRGGARWTTALDVIDQRQLGPPARAVPRLRSPWGGHGLRRRRRRSLLLRIPAIVNTGTAPS